MQSLQNNQRYDALDGLRGIAAIIVMLSHYSQYFGLNWFKNASVAVDLFFVLSGLVIVHSYGRKVLIGMSFKSFLILRFIRLAPLNFLAVVIGCTNIIIGYFYLDDHGIKLIILFIAFMFGREVAAVI